jgi:thioredoxin-like negative regulator of GroEL
MKQNPADSKVRFNLAGAYLNRGLRSKAIELLKTVITDFPTQKDQADYYIREIQAGRNP